MCYMMSKQGYLNDRDGHWQPHLMFFLPPTDPTTWGAGTPGSPVIGARGKWQISSGGGRMPNWSRDGKNLFFETLDGRIATAGYAVKGETFLPGKPVVWSDKQIFAPTSDENFDVAPDRRKIAAMMQLPGDSGGSVHVTFLLNFFDELRRRVPVSK